MRQRLVSADYFYNDPYALRKQALAAEYKDNISVNGLVTDEAIDKLCYIVQSQVELLEGFPNGHFKFTTESTPLGPVSANPQADWIALVYLTLPAQAEGNTALSLYTHRRTNCEGIPSPVEQRLQGWNTAEEMLEGFVLVDGMKEPCWTPWYTAYQRYNRVIVFDAHCWHRELQGFGDAINNCRLTQLFYLRNK
jgi:hypothetical protein